MASEPDSKTESEEPKGAEENDGKANAFLVGIALNLGRATRVLTNGFGALGQTAKKLGSGAKLAARQPRADAEAAGDDEPQPRGEEQEAVDADEMEDGQSEDESKAKKKKK